MLASGFEWFLLMDMRDVAVAVVIRVLELRKGIIVRRSFHPNVVYLYLLMGLQVVINNHATTTDNRHLAHLAWFEPATLNGREAFMAKHERHVCNVFYIGSHMRVALTVHRSGKFTENVKN